jgi:hypothetical protein
MDIGKAGEHRKLQLTELEEIRNESYESSRIYKERTKKMHDNMIMRREFVPGQSVLVYDTRFHLFPGKLKSRWFGPCIVRKVFPNGAIVVQSQSGGTFSVNGQRLKHYTHGEKIPNIEEGMVANNNISTHVGE